MKNPGERHLIESIPNFQIFDDLHKNFKYFYDKSLQSNCSLISQILPFFIHQFFLYNFNKNEIKDLWMAFMKPKESDKNMNLY